jgi:hypothetical protein
MIEGSLSLLVTNGSGGPKYIRIQIGIHNTARRNSGLLSLQFYYLCSVIMLPNFCALDGVSDKAVIADADIPIDILSLLEDRYRVAVGGFYCSTSIRTST